MTHPQPLTLPQPDDDQDVAALISVHFGPGSTVIGLTALSPHGSIHRADLATPRRPRCGMTSHGQRASIVRAYAVTDTDYVSAITALLTEAGVEPCRMCRRCWKTKAHQIPSHKRACFRSTPGI